MSVAIFIPSLNRPHRLKTLAENIHAVTSLPHTIYFMVSDAQSIIECEAMREKYFVDGGGTYIQRMNYMYLNTTEPYMFMGSDDLLFHANWLEEALKADMPLVIVNDLFNPNGTMALIRRDYIDTHSGCVDTPRVLFYPGYTHNYADTEQHKTAYWRGAGAYAHDSHVEHLHFGNGKSPMDATYGINTSSAARDYELYQSRRQLFNG